MPGHAVVHLEGLDVVGVRRNLRGTSKGMHRSAATIASAVRHCCKRWQQRRNGRVTDVVVQHEVLEWYTQTNGPAATFRGFMSHAWYTVVL